MELQRFANEAGSDVLAGKRQQLRVALGAAQKKLATDKQIDTIERLQRETGQPVVWQAFHFMLGEMSPEFPTRSALLDWIRKTDSECLASIRREKREERVAAKEKKPKVTKASKKAQRDALWKQEHEEELMTFAYED